MCFFLDAFSSISLFYYIVYVPSFVSSYYIRHARCAHRSPKSRRRRPFAAITPQADRRAEFLPIIYNGALHLRRGSTRAFLAFAAHRSRRQSIVLFVFLSVWLRFSHFPRRLRFRALRFVRPKHPVLSALCRRRGQKTEKVTKISEKVSKTPCQIRKNAL